MSPAEFAHEVLVDRLHAAAVVVGPQLHLRPPGRGQRRAAHRARRPVRVRGRGRRRWPRTARATTSRSPRPTSAPASTPATSRPRPPRSAARTASRAWSCTATGAAASWGSPRRTSPAAPYTALPADGVYAGRFVIGGATAAGGGLGGLEPDVLRHGAHGRGVRARRRRGLLRPRGRRRLRSRGCAARSATTTSTRWSRRSTNDVGPHPRRARRLSFSGRAARLAASLRSASATGVAGASIRTCRPSRPLAATPAPDARPARVRIAPQPAAASASSTARRSATGCGG